MQKSKEFVIKDGELLFGSNRVLRKNNMKRKQTDYTGIQERRPKY